MLSPDLLKRRNVMRKLILNVGLVLAIIYIVPFVVYGVGSVVAGSTPPEGASPALFLVTVFVSKFATAICFVLIFYLAREELSGRWVLYAGLWWLMFIVGEVGQAIGPRYSRKEAIAGIISETVYWPLSALVTNWMTGAGRERRAERWGEPSGPVNGSKPVRPEAN
jgi:MFS family permease